MTSNTSLDRFNESVLSKFNIYNSIFSTLPYDSISNTAVMLPLFSRICSDGFDKGLNPTEIVEKFFNQFLKDASEDEKISLLFQFIQYIERQVVLFDAIEDAGFSEINNLKGRGTLKNFKEEAKARGELKKLEKHLKHLKIRLVLTAHPTQFYPGSVLGIITDLAASVQKNDLPTIKGLLSQLGKTPFFKQKKPTPYDEATSLIWYLENVFYFAVSNIQNYIKHNISSSITDFNEIVNLGFWPGGDRDGNPFVTTEITIKTAQKLRSTLIKNYYRDARRLRRRLTFRDVEPLIVEIETKLYRSIFQTTETPKISLEELKEKLQTIKDLLINDHQSLFLDEVEEFIGRVDVFGFYFASLDIRQDSRVHHTAFSQLLSDAKSSGVTLMKKEYSSMTEQEKMKVLPSLVGDLSLDLFQDDLVKKTLGSIRAMKQIQRSNGEKGCNRYIISNNQSALNVLEVFAMIRLSDWEVPSVDIAPLFETVPDLEVAPDVMDAIYSDPTYRAHLELRGNKQTIMLGFSDGTKDGGYLMANWSIYKAKENLSRISRKHGIKVLFFDGRGGPPARGGGNTHQFYASLGKTIESDEIQLTVQGQTISSNFGTIDSCQYNLEQLLSAGITNKVFGNDSESLSKEDRKTMDKLAKISYQVYSDFKSHPCFIPYLERMSTLKYYAKTNIGSRPSKRGKSEGLNFSDLRAIPFVGSWSQLKQNVPGFYGVGSALQEFVEAGNFKEVKSLYQNSAFFRTLLSNSMMSLTKSFFKLTAYMQNDPEFGDFWKLIYEEYKLTKSLLLKLSGYNTLMEDQPAGKASIMVRENIVLPLLTIQQYALQTIQKMEAEGGHSKKELLVFEKMVTRSLFGNINASRNSA